MRFLERLRRMMYGRYGIDGLWYVLLAVCVIICVVNVFVRSYILEVVYLLIMMWAIFRVFSTNQARRAKENEVVMGLFRPLTGRIRRLRYFKTHVYRTCPHCGKTLRFPRKKGVHQATCPVCRQDFTVKIRF